MRILRRIRRNRQRGEVFKNGVECLERKEVFLKSTRRWKVLSRGLEDRKKMKRSSKKNGGGEIMIKRAGHFINCRRRAYSGMIVTASSLFFNIMEFFLFSCHLWVSLLWSECGYIACLISVDLWDDMVFLLLSYLLFFLIMTESNLTLFHFVVKYLRTMSLILV